MTYRASVASDISVKGCLDLGNSAALCKYREKQTGSVGNTEIMRIQQTTLSVSGHIVKFAIGVFTAASLLSTTLPGTANAQQGGQMDELRQRIVNMCNEAWADDQPREEQCRKDSIKQLEDYIKLVNSYPPNSDHYRVLIECSQKWPDAIPMWKMCANLEMPNEPAFKPFSTGITPMEALRQYQAAQPNSMAPADPRRLPDNLRNLPNVTLPNSDGSGSYAGQTGSPQRAPASSLYAPRPVQQQQQQSGGGVYVPGGGINR